ncbi:rhodanese-like domain-containing protein [Rubrivirga marina]|uniref:Sulfurtransferase n=1 Tax=Rubrivirga marina TaxID=1196024 RepID=A0A271IY44_9BACT|nr:rhodanese-like domain-containing protein [Rubrivirga marina]PAP75714.1 sulfurtransferase [Rubrivirga marina]
MTHSPRFLALVDAARAEITETDPATVRQRMEAGEDMVLVDVREPDEWDRGHLPGAVAMPRGVLERDIEAAFPDPDAPLVLYCGGGYRSALAARALEQMGYANVRSMDGGWRAWTEAGYPTETD